MNEFVHIGTDPEFFVISTGEFDYIPEGYSIPPVVYRIENQLKLKRLIGIRHYVFWEKNGYIIHEDGAAFELTTPPFNDIIEMKNSVLGILGEAEKDLGLKFTIIPAAKFMIPDKFKNNESFITACEFGCNPDIEGCMPDINLTTRTIRADDIPYRFGGGHITIEFKEEHKNLFVNYPDIFSQFMAINVGIPMIAFTRFPHLLKERAKYYGTPCKYRDNKLHKNLFEYRTPSNEWLLFTDEQLMTIQKGINTAIKMFTSRDETARSFLSRYLPEAKAIILSSDVRAAKLVMKELTQYFVE